MRPIVRAAALVFLSGLPFTTALAVRAVAGAPAIRPPSADPYVDHIAEAARRFGVPAAWIRAVMRHESGGDPRAVSPKGAIGLMQVMPATWGDLAVRHALGSDPFDPRANILAGTAFLRAMHDRYGTVPAMLAAYSAGPARADQWLAGRPLPPETRAYVAALAPLIEGGDAVVAPVALPPDPLAWTRAPLFVTRSDDEHAIDQAQPGRREDDTDGVRPGRDPAAAATRAGTLFARSDRGEGR